MKPSILKAKIAFYCAGLHLAIIFVKRVIVICHDPYYFVLIYVVCKQNGYCNFVQILKVLFFLGHGEKTEHLGKN